MTWREQFTGQSCPCVSDLKELKVEAGRKNFIRDEMHTKWSEWIIRDRAYESWIIHSIEFYVLDAILISHRFLIFKSAMESWVICYELLESFQGREHVFHSSFHYFSSEFFFRLTANTHMKLHPSTLHHIYHSNVVVSQKSKTVKWKLLP